MERLKRLVFDVLWGILPGELVAQTILLAFVQEMITDEQRKELLEAVWWCGMVNRVANKMLPGAYQATLVARMEKLEDDLVRVAAGRRDLKEMLLSLITGQLGPEYAEVFAQRMGIEISS